MCVIYVGAREGGDERATFPKIAQWFDYKCFCGKHCRKIVLIELKTVKKYLAQYARTVKYFEPIKWIIEVIIATLLVWFTNTPASHQLD